MAVGQHIQLRLRDNSVIAATPREQRIVARSVLERGHLFGLLCFSAADTHIHMNTDCDESGANEYARRVEISLTRGLRKSVGFARAVVTPVVEQFHLHNLFDYILRQDKRHGVEQLDPHREASNLPDLLGMRPLGAFTVENVRRKLPRVTRGDLLRLIGVSRLDPADGPLGSLMDAVRAVVCRGDPPPRSAEMMGVLTAAVKVAGGQLSSQALSRVLEISRRTIYNLRLRNPEHDLVNAIRLQLGLRQVKQSSDNPFGR